MTQNQKGRRKGRGWKSSLPREPSSWLLLGDVSTSAPPEGIPLRLKVPCPPTINTALTGPLELPGGRPGSNPDTSLSLSVLIWQVGIMIGLTSL